MKPMRGAAVVGALLAPLAVASPAAARPASWSVIRTFMHRTYELPPFGDQHFGSFSRRTVTPDGHGGSLTAVVGVRMPTADGYGRLVFFFHNQRFLGWASNRESIAIGRVRAAGRRRFRVTYPRYRRADALCCPSGGQVSVLYRWNGHRMVAGRKPPQPSWNTTRVRLRKR